MKKIFLLAAPIFLLTAQAYACSVCFGDPSAPATKGIKNGVLLLLGVVFVVLSCFGTLFVRIAQRSRKGITHV